MHLQVHFLVHWAYFFLIFFLIFFLTFSNWKMFKQKQSSKLTPLVLSQTKGIACLVLVRAAKQEADGWKLPDIGDHQQSGCPEGAQPRTFLQSLTEHAHAIPKMSDTEKYCWWMRREIGARQLREALKGKQPFLLPFLSFCGLTIPKHYCCPSCQGVCAACRIPNATMSSRLKKQVLLKDATCHLRSSACWNL